MAARALEPVAAQLSDALRLGEPFHDEGVSYFGLRNAVFAIGDQFLEIVCPVKDDAAAGRLIERRGGDCGYMLMFQVDDLGAARERAAGCGVREVFAVELDDIEEVHLHPGDMQGAIVALSSPRPPAAWRWGGDGWEQRAVPATLTGVTVAVKEVETVRERWNHVIGGTAGVSFIEGTAGPVEVMVAGSALNQPESIAGVRFSPSG